MSAVERVTIHHEGAGKPTDFPRGGAEGYTYWIGATYWTRLRSPAESWATLHFNHVSLDVCLSGDRMVHALTDRDLELVRGAVADCRNRGEVVDAPDVVAHKFSPGSSTLCPGDNTMARWLQVEAACRTPQKPPVPPKVRPMYDPPVEVLGGIAASAQCPTGGDWKASPDGHLYAFEGAPFAGLAVYGKPYWGDRRVSKIHARRYGFLKRKVGLRWTATTGEIYNLPDGT